MLPVTNRVLYLHGFASSPQSRKATYFKARLEEAGYHCDVLDLAQGRFEDLTISNQLDVIAGAALGQPVVLIGSSLGGYLACAYAKHHIEVKSLVLLAPAFHFYESLIENLSAEKKESWRKTGSAQIFHYALGRETSLKWTFAEDALRHEPAPDVGQPVLIFHGNFDPVVPVTRSIEYTARHPQAKLVRFDSGHELTDVLEPMWQQTLAFLKAGS